jgi:hypothetical protein
MRIKAIVSVVAQNKNISFRHNLAKAAAIGQHMYFTIISQYESLTQVSTRAKFRSQTIKHYNQFIRSGHFSV